VGGGAPPGGGGGGAPPAQAVCDTDDAFSNGGRVTIDLSGGNSEDLQTAITQPCVADLVPPRSVSHVVTVPIDLDHQPRFRAVEIEHIRPRGLLTAEPQPARAAA
jgi:hypothetical protein